MAQKLTYGIGCNSKRTHKTVLNGKRTLMYSAWHAMMQRCYSQNYHKRNPTYIGCSVDTRWHDFQDFADWYESSEFSNLGYQLDKDLLVSSNKVYSPETCCFVPIEINNLLLSRTADRGMYPQGVSFHKRDLKFISRLRIKGRLESIGRFNCPNEAYQAYKTTKEAHVKVMALEWKDRIAPEVFDALMRWKLNTKKQTTQDEQPTDRFAMGTSSVDHAGEKKEDDSDGGRSEPLHDFLDMFGLSDKSVDDIADGILGANNKDNNK